MFNRKEFLKYFGLSSLSVLFSLFIFRKTRSFSNKKIPGKISGANYNSGHRLHQKIKQIPTNEQPIGTIIVGAGISGLSAGWYLKKNGYTDFLILELDSEVGGNSRAGENRISKYPFGAHYVPIPGVEAKYVREFFEEIGVIEGYQDNLPIFNEYYLCSDPHERLYFQGSWQDGLIPVRGIPSNEKNQLNEFFTFVENLKNKRGRDGKYAFVIPLELSSKDPEFLILDQESMFSFMQKKGWNSEYLNWYVGYCCRDDFGVSHKHVSAWAGLHYFSSRASKAANADPQTVITWPEGNGFLVHKFKEKLQSNIRTESLVYNIDFEDSNKFIVDEFNSKINSHIRYKTQNIIYAAPRFSAKYVIKNYNFDSSSKVMPTPWLVANISLKNKPKGNGVPLAWDNVSYYSRSLGYIVSTHQDLKINRNETVITYYLPLDEVAPKLERKRALDRTYDEWVQLILPDLERIHPEITNEILEIDLWIWGHGMVNPGINYLWSANRKKLLSNFKGIEFAHSEMSGISIFEEAQFRGCEAAKKILRKV